MMDTFNNNSNSSSGLGNSGEFSNKFSKIGSAILYGYYDYLTATSRVLHGEDEKITIYSILVHSYECNSNQTYGVIGDSCKINDDCYFPNICFENKCSKYKMPGEACYKKQDCTLNYNFGDCINGKCELIIETGDKCNNNNSTGNGKCQSSSECINGICKLKKSCNQYNCPLNQYCDDKLKQCKPIPIDTVSLIKCKSDSSSNQCPSSHICDESLNKCIEKYSKKLGESCKSSPLLCNVYNGEICDTTKSNKCIKNEQYFKECKDESNCNGGLCICVNGTSVCVGPSGQLNNPKCIELEKQVQQCLLKEKCNTISPISCNKCFKQYECLQYQCNAIEHYYTYKERYYNILHCENQ